MPSPINPLNSLSSLTVATDVPTLGEARIVGILDEHGNREIQRFQVRLIRALANQDKDVLLVEDSYWKDASLLRCDLITQLGLQRMQVAGWCSVHLTFWQSRLDEELAPTRLHIQRLEKCLTGVRPKVLMEACAHLLAAARYVWGESQVKPADFVEPILRNKMDSPLFQKHKDYLILAGKALMEKRTQEWLDLTFPRHHGTLLKRIDQLLEQGKRRIFFVAGAQHGDPTVSRQKEETQSVLEALKNRGHFAVLNPMRVASGTLAYMKPSPDSSLLDEEESESNDKIESPLPCSSSAPVP